jgi:hypothetical protein
MRDTPDIWRARDPNAEDWRKIQNPYVLECCRCGFAHRFFLRHEDGAPADNGFEIRGETLTDQEAADIRAKLGSKS